MKIRFFTYSLVVVASALLFATCNKNVDDAKYCTKVPGDCKSVQEAKDYFAFKVGSWWVYEEETSGERDSCYVTYGSNNPNSSSFTTEIYSVYQDYSYNYYSKFIGALQGCDEDGPVLKRCLFVDREKGKPGEYVGHGYCFLSITE